MSQSGYSLPAAFLRRIETQLGAELEGFLAALADPPEGLRVNTLRVEVSRFLELAPPFLLQPLPYPPEGFVVETGSRPGRHPYHSAGLYYLQDPGAMVVGALVEARPGERILDLAAAPGGKATHLAAQMAGTGLLIANDISRARAFELAGNLERCGVKNAMVLSDRVDRLADGFGAWFDRVLVDAPCSGESMFHKSAAARSDWSEASVAGCSRRQREILPAAARLVKPGGTLFYSTCTFAAEENEEVAASFLDTASEFRPAQLPPVPGAQPAAAGTPDGAPGAYRLWPHRVPGAGHFIAAFRRDDETEQLPPRARTASSLPSAPREARQQFERFMEATYADSAAEHDDLVMMGRELFAQPHLPAGVASSHVVRPGVHLGTVRPDRFEPAHGLAMTTSLDEATDPLNLELDDRRLEGYLTGHPIEAAGLPGWVPIGVNGFPLGWGKRVGKTVKNHYPTGLRWRG